MANSPIADLTYRNYDGPIKPPVYRWTVIARMSIQMALKKKGFWTWAALSAYWYVILAAVFYFTGAVGEAAPGNARNFESAMMKNIVWKDQFLNAFSVGQLLFFILALLIGIGSIANDNRANALLVYLSKPCTKLDYLIGKWFGIAIPLILVQLVPTLLFYFYCLLSYREQGFLSQDPWLIVKLIVISFIPGAVHASLALGISSLFNQGRMAGATYAGLYFLTLFFTKAIQIARFVAFQHQDLSNIGATVNNLFYASVDGLQIGLAKAILGTEGSGLLPIQNSNAPPGVPAPELATILIIVLVICGVSLSVAWNKVRAVEVIGG